MGGVVAQQFVKQLVKDATALGKNTLILYVKKYRLSHDDNGRSEAVNFFRATF
jgi:hypothetical protein